jgi:putative ABC transport system ATP-binding protein
MPVVELCELVKKYGRGARAVTALRGVSFVARRPEIVAVTGPNGAGKSTLLNLVGALDRPTRGTVLVDGRDLSSLSDDERSLYRRRVGIVFQSLHLSDRLSALENVALPQLIDGVPPERVHPEADRLLRRLGLGRRVYHLAGELSTSERQRVAVARALLSHPALVLADEPTEHLDSECLAVVAALFRACVTGDGATVFIASHHPVGRTFCDREVELVDGRVVADVELAGRVAAGHRSGSRRGRPRQPT